MNKPTAGQTAPTWTLDGFVEHFDFVHHAMLDHKFVWVLGAGASYPSGIPLGSELVDRWLSEMHKRYDTGALPVEEWATAETLSIPNFRYASRATFYSKVYEQRFRDYPEEGYAYLEGLMSGKDPSPGYSILAAALATQPPRHNVVITTNFDNLVADSLAIYSDTFPFICGHESLTAFVRASMRRPLICKIHRDLLLAPQNDPRSLRRLHDAWGTALRGLFQQYTPIFIGYGGNDDTLMDLLESLQLGDIKGQMIWCYYEGGTPSERIVNVVSDHQGVLVPTPDFDLLMVLLGERMAIRLLDEEIGRRANARTQQYRDRIQRLDTVKHPTVTKALAATFDRSGGWWAWEQKARLEKDPKRRDVVYRQALQHCPGSFEIRTVFAGFLKHRNPDEAEKLYKAAIDLSPKDVAASCQFAQFMWRVRGDDAAAEKLYKSALKIDRDGALVSYAFFLWQRCGKIEEAVALVEEAATAHPKDADSLGVLAFFRWLAQGQHGEAEEMFQSALKLSLRDANVHANYACFLIGRGRFDEAAQHIRQAKHSIGARANALAAEIALYEAVLARLKGKDDSAAIAGLKALFQTEFAREGMHFDELLDFVRKKLPKADHLVFSALAAGILDGRKVPNIDDLLKNRAATISRSGVGAKSDAKKITKKRSSRTPAVNRKRATRKKTHYNTLSNGARNRRR